PYSITITATIPLRNAAVQLYTDMLIVDNHEGIYNAYQWYRNGEALPGATLLYYTEPKFDYNSLYTVKLSGDGKEMMSCPVEWLSTAKALKPSIKVYPNPAKQGENFTLEILDFDEDQNYDIVIFTANGTMVKKISNVEQKTSVTLPSGVYSGSLINGGEKKGFKLIVK
ncbi:MAG: T9SS type A sorting domain-containing protein, partial [Bacteroidales bacterium]|nr:T9SS type A sorting domain-containing protein [Bacteroidales bacterium]